jgi:hypothetical protein
VFCFINTNNFEYRREGGGERRERGARRGAEEKEVEEKKVKIDLKVSTKFQINPSTNDRENYIQSNMGTDGQTN